MTQSQERILFLNGTIAEESWFDDEVTPALFKDELDSGEGDITVWINSPGGDCIAAAQIYNMLMNYKGNVTVKIDGIAASAASVIAMAGNKVIVSHRPHHDENYLDKFKVFLFLIRQKYTKSILLIEVIKDF